MVGILKCILAGGGIVTGSVAVVTPIVVTKLPSFSIVLPSKAECHGFRNFGLKVKGKMVSWAAEKDSLEQANREQYKSLGEIVEGDKTSCDQIETSAVTS